MDTGQAVPEAVKAAVREYPELQRIVDLQGAGWLFFPSIHDGDVVEVRGVRSWPEGYADAMLVRNTNDAAALRGDHTGGIVWQDDGSLVDIVDKLITLPSPSSSHAPKLVRGTMPRLWTP